MPNNVYDNDEFQVLTWFPNAWVQFVVMLQSITDERWCPNNKYTCPENIQWNIIMGILIGIHCQFSDISITVQKINMSCVKDVITSDICWWNLCVKLLSLNILPRFYVRFSCLCTLLSFMCGVLLQIIFALSSFLPFFCIVCPSIHGICLPLWYLQHFLLSTPRRLMWYDHDKCEPSNCKLKNWGY